MGAWGFVGGRIEDVARATGCEHPEPRYVGRKAAASPATGTYERHEEQQTRLVDEALTVDGPSPSDGGPSSKKRKASQRGSGKGRSSKSNKKGAGFGNRDKKSEGKGKSEKAS